MRKRIYQCLAAGVILLGICHPSWASAEAVPMDIHQPETAMAAAAAIIAAASAVVTGMAAARAMAMAAGAVTAPMCLSAPTPRAMPRMLPLWHPSAPSVWMTSLI